VGPCLLPCDADVRPQRPAILYGIDMRATAEIEELTERFGADALLGRGGKALSTQAVGPKILWVRRHEPEVWERTAGWYNSSSFAVARLTGEYVLDHHTASQCDPLYDLAASDWATDWAEEVAPGVPLPRLVWASDVVGTVHEVAAAQTGLPVGTPVSAGTVDAWAEAFSAGVRRHVDLMLMYGSTMFFIQVLDEPARTRCCGRRPGSTPARGRWRRGWRRPEASRRGSRRSPAVRPFPSWWPRRHGFRTGSDGLVVLPDLAGERTPVFDPQARGVVVGPHAPAHASPPLPCGL